MFIPQRIAYAIGFHRSKCNLRDIRDIYDNAKCSSSWVGFQTILLIKSKLDF